MLIIILIINLMDLEVSTTLLKHNFTSVCVCVCGSGSGGGSVSRDDWHVRQQTEREDTPWLWVAPSKRLTAWMEWKGEEKASQFALESSSSALGPIFC